MLIINLSYLSFRATCALPFSPFPSFLPMRKRFRGVRRKSPSHSLILEFLRKYAFILRWRKPWMHCDVHCYLRLVRRFQTLSPPARRERDSILDEAPPKSWINEFVFDLQQRDFYFRPRSSCMRKNFMSSD